eukprot:3711216-Alexandrium_andersonii.AAC.1
MSSLPCGSPTSRDWLSNISGLTSNSARSVHSFSMIAHARPMTPRTVSPQDFSGFPSCSARPHA